MSMIRALLMDDDYDVRLLAERMARRLDIELELSASDDEAVSAFARAEEEGRPFDVVILDVTIPGRRGAIEVVAALRAIRPNTPAIVTSGFSEGGVVARHYDFGFGAALGKPFDHEELGRAIEEALTRPVHPGRIAP